jgi:hypothetical protein
MTEFDKIKAALIAAGHDPALVARTEETAESLRKILGNIEAPPKDNIKDVFEEMS